MRILILIATAFNFVFFMMSCSKYTQQTGFGLLSKMDSTEFIKSGLNRLRKEEFDYLEKWIRKYLSNINENYMKNIEEIKTEYSKDHYEWLADNFNIWRIKDIDFSNNVITIEKVDRFGEKNVEKWEGEPSRIFDSPPVWHGWDKGDRVILIGSNVMANLDKKLKTEVKALNHKKRGKLDRNY